MFKSVKELVVVGGGTSAWFTAAFIARNCDIKVTLIDKEVGDSVGVGEGTLLNFDKFLKRCGFRTDEWFDEIDATYKSGIFFPNWGKDDNLVWHPFYLNREYWEHKTSVYEAWTHHQNKYDFAELGAFFNITQNNKVDTQNLNYYAMHVDAGKLVTFLQNKLKDHIKIIKSEVTDVHRDDDDFVTSVTLKDGQNIKADLFVDCTGFKQLLQRDPQKVTLEGRLFCDTAVAGHVPYANVEAERHPHVISEAVDHGWIWNIPVQTRIGSGLVFNRSVTSIDEAKDYFCNYWDNRITPDKLKVIDWTPYYLKNMWDKNVVAIGLSGGFIEPLESTGIAMITKGIYELTNYIRQNFFVSADVDMFNSIMVANYEDTINFINMHYRHTDFDTPFWNFVKDTYVPSETLLWYEDLFRQGEKLPADSKGFIFGGASWLCWMCQTAKEIGPNKYVTPEVAKTVLDTWKGEMDIAKQKAECISHTEAIVNYAVHLDMIYDPNTYTGDTT